jgi:hypothetical protein
VNRKFLLAGGLAGAMAIGSGATVVIADWCADDPMIQVSPTQVVYLTNYADTQYLASLQAVQWRVLATYLDASGALHVTLLIYIPNSPQGQFDTRYVISTGPDGSGNVLVTGEGQSGSLIIVRFVLPN